MLLFGVKSFECSFFWNLYNSVSWRYCLLLYHFTDKKTKVKGVKLLAKGHESSGQGFPLKSLQLRSLNLLSIMLSAENPRGDIYIYFFLPGSKSNMKRKGVL